MYGTDIITPIRKNTPLSFARLVGGVTEPPDQIITLSTVLDSV